MTFPQVSGLRPSAWSRCLTGSLCEQSVSGLIRTRTFFRMRVGPPSAEPTPGNPPAVARRFSRRARQVAHAALALALGGLVSAVE
jgi:hypothetical protein